MHTLLVEMQQGLAAGWRWSTTITGIMTKTSFIDSIFHKVWKFQKIAYTTLKRTHFFSPLRFWKDLGAFGKYILFRFSTFSVCIRWVQVLDLKQNNPINQNASKKKSNQSQPAGVHPHQSVSFQGERGGAAARVQLVRLTGTAGE